MEVSYFRGAARQGAGSSTHRGTAGIRRLGEADPGDRDQYRFHAVPTDSCPFGTAGVDTVLVHADAYLPNVLYRGDTPSGFIGAVDTCVGGRDIDLATAVWSLQYNLGTGYGCRFLERYGRANVDVYVCGDRLRPLQCGEGGLCFCSQC